ncbi:ATP-grasp domain-containing protein, partial [Candidatus Peregrinibacteria bacterium]|nr:ATP-grasp domain-containing protein [Candidatus Peregrinibacteria bacterium]
WHINGIPVSIERVAHSVDVVWNALHGEYGEDGKIQQILHAFGIPYTGSTPFASAVGMNKALAKNYFSHAGIKTPLGIVVRQGDDVTTAALNAFKKIPPPYVVKPLTSGSSIGLSLTRTIDGLTTAIDYALKYSPAVLVEEYIKGKEVTCGVIDSLEHDQSHATHPVEIVLPEGMDVFHHSLKHSDVVQRISPARLSDSEREILQALAIRAHRGIGMRHYSVADFIVSPRGIYLLEVNSLPGLTEKSLLPLALESADLSLEDFIDHILTLALNKK